MSATIFPTFLDELKWLDSSLSKDFLPRKIKSYFLSDNEAVREAVIEGYRLEEPRDAPTDFWAIAQSCWDAEARQRPKMKTLSIKLAQLN